LTRYEERNAFSSNGTRIGKCGVVVIILICIILFAAMMHYYPEIFKKSLKRQKRDVIGIIRIKGYILDHKTVNEYVTLINESLRNDSIRGVVLLIDSGGGYADYIEEIYADLLKFKDPNISKPLIASVIRALSGGYYIAVACDYIYVLNSSFVGSIGAIGSVPPVLIPSERVIESGPHKWTGESVLSGYFTLNRVVDSFVSAVEIGRGSKLKISAAELRKASVYLGCEALKLGLADAIGGLQDAIDKAAKEANVTEYAIEELKIPRKEESLQPSSEEGFMNQENITLETLIKLHPPPAFYYIYLPSYAISKSNVSEQIVPFGNISLPSGRAEVLIDLSHGNMISWWVLDTLISELAERDVTVGFISQAETLEKRLGNASCLIVASPTKMYSDIECETIEAFVNKGGLLLLFFDPAWEYIGTSGLLQGVITPINSLSTRFGISFAKGYLYNDEEYFGIYRNVYIKRFRMNPITKNLNSIVFFTATHIRSRWKGIAWTSDDTHSSIAEKAGRYAVMAWVDQGNGTVIAFGDLTFLQEPYCYVEDDYKIIENVASVIAEKVKSS